MPIYEYVCGHCGHELDKLQKMSADPITLCPECHKETLSRKISASAFKLTGSGWYATDFKDKKPKSDTPSNASEKPGEKATQGDTCSEKKESAASSKESCE